MKKDKRDGQWCQTLTQVFLPKRETLCLTRAANLQKILRHEERERKREWGKKGEVKGKKGEGMEEKKECEVRAVKTEGKKINMVQ